MMLSNFIGRAHELKLLRGLLEKETASLAVVYGRRRIGKSSLVEAFCKDKKSYSFMGLAPEAHTTKTSQLEEFSRQLARQFSTPEKSFNDWGDAFNELALYTKTGQVIIFFDEITWIGNKDSDFLGKLKNAWDLLFKKNNKLILILCGSISSWIDKYILSNTGFYGRISLKIHLKEMPIKDCNKFWDSDNISPQEKLKVLSVIGGIPKYLEEVRFNLSAEENIKQLCFLESGLLFNDFDYIFSALLERKSPYYNNLLSILSNNSKERTEIMEELNVKRGGIISSYIDELVSSGLIERDYTWHFHSEHISRFSKYRLADNYLRFYIHYIKPNLHKIKTNRFKDVSLSTLPGYSSILGFQIENLVLNNRQDIKELIGIYNDEVVFDNPYFQRTTERHKGCQIDYLIQTKFGNLYLCEVKFSRNIIKKDIINEVERKIQSLAKPRNFSVRPVLIHASEVHDEVLDSNYFAKIINLASLFF